MTNLKTNCFTNTPDIKNKLNRLLIIRMNHELYERIDHALMTTPALAGMNRSIFARKALIYALESVKPADEETLAKIGEQDNVSRLPDDVTLLKQVIVESKSFRPPKA